MKKLLILFTLIFLSLTFSACTGNTTESLTNITTDNVSSNIDKEIIVLQKNVDLPISSEYFLEYELNFTLYSSEALSFSSSNPEIASVNMLGKVIAHEFGDAVITVYYSDDVKEDIEISVSKYYEMVLPIKTIYALDEEINTYGGEINVFNEDGTLDSTKAITRSMIVDEKFNHLGSQLIEVNDEGIIYSFEIFRLNDKQVDILFDDLIELNNDFYVGEKVEFALLKYDTTKLLEAIDNVYDYQEINIYAIFNLPDDKTDKVSAFWYQDYEEKLTDITINPNLRLEGTVNDTDSDYDVFVNLNSNGFPHYRLRYLPEIEGDYQVNLVVEVDDIIIQVIEKVFTVKNKRDDTYRGFVRVDKTTNQSFVFDNEESYIPVGQNVAWYTSVERKHYDYKAWFEQMNEVGMNYSRVWMAAWGFSPFWDDIYNFDERQTNLYSLDKTLEMAEEEDIYIQLCILHHGMFSTGVNPMWPGSSETWYTNKYGSNPYGDVISNPGLFFTQADMKQNFRNQLSYIVARYGYSDHIMSFELFNEVDWIEEYNASDGLLWHKEMSDYLKAIDPNKHLVTTSLKDQSGVGNFYKVFQLSSIDYINVHHYGIYNHTDFLPEKQYFIQNEYNKPVMYNEIGYSGMGGQEQYNVDPNNVTLHQGLWAGTMGGGSGTGMHWWWESWVETYDVYHEYLGVSKYLKEVNLTGTDLENVNSELSGDSVSISSTSLGFMGYKYADRLYLYIFDKGYNLHNQNPILRQNIELDVSSLNNDVYQLVAYNTFDGSIISSQLVDINSETTSITLPNFSKDIAIILKIVD